VENDLAFRLKPMHPDLCETNASETGETGASHSRLRLLLILIVVPLKF
jgi:hypothetical protein